VSARDVPGVLGILQQLVPTKLAAWLLGLGVVGLYSAAGGDFFWSGLCPDVALAKSGGWVFGVGPAAEVRTRSYNARSGKRALSDREASFGEPVRGKKGSALLPDLCCMTRRRTFSRFCQGEGRGQKRHSLLFFAAGS
jgi:hypothetical protein